jgi:CRISPR/Cas system-associated protein Cas5 (RAMP superfamily)
MEKEYDLMIDALNGNNIHTRDSFKFYKNFNPITYADKDPETGVMETCLTYVEDLGSRQSLDYIFECFLDEEFEESSKEIKPDVKKKLIIDPDQLRVEKFLVSQITHINGKEKNTKLYSQLSDHYGLTCEIVYKSKYIIYKNLRIK